MRYRTVLIQHELTPTLYRNLVWNKYEMLGILSSLAKFILPEKYFVSAILAMFFLVLRLYVYGVFLVTTGCNSKWNSIFWEMFTIWYTGFNIQYVL